MVKPAGRSGSRQTENGDRLLFESPTDSKPVRPVDRSHGVQPLDHTRAAPGKRLLLRNRLRICGQARGVL